MASATGSATARLSRTMATVAGMHSRAARRSSERRLIRRRKVPQRTITMGLVHLKALCSRMGIGMGPITISMGTNRARLYTRATLMFTAMMTPNFRSTWMVQSKTGSTAMTVVTAAAEMGAPARRTASTVRPLRLARPLWEYASARCRQKSHDRPTRMVTEMASMAPMSQFMSQKTARRAMTMAARLMTVSTAIHGSPVKTRMAKRADTTAMVTASWRPSTICCSVVMRTHR
mmetsp:Transcript_16503/g.46060  ORF Transcript_16503/g.46060 Transcript_16503/m.46060 type:complete len:232 (+) Transcript_16503:337-1032(+)